MENDDFLRLYCLRCAICPRNLTRKKPRCKILLKKYPELDCLIDSLRRSRLDKAGRAAPGDGVRVKDLSGEGVPEN